PLLPPRPAGGRAGGGPPPPRPPRPPPPPPSPPRPPPPPRRRGAAHLVAPRDALDSAVGGGASPHRGADRGIARDRGPPRVDRAPLTARAMARLTRCAPRWIRTPSKATSSKAPDDPGRLAPRARHGGIRRPNPPPCR